MQEINTVEVFKNIKKHRGERFAKMLRKAELLDVPNIEHILEFAQLEDLEKLIPAIRSKCKMMSFSQYNTDKTPLELLDEAGYDAFIVKTEKQKDSIKKYYRPGEELCTFGDSYRHKNFYIIHAVKRGADKIKPADIPQREDEYGTSVISIQIAKGGGFISIKNRYNHTVNNPDATFGNNPDNIIPGLTNSLRKFFGVEFNIFNVTMPDNYVWVNDQLVWYDFEKDNIYFGEDYYFTGGTITRLNKDREIMFEGMIYNDKDKTITSPIKDDATAAVFAEAFNGKKISRTYDKTTKETTLTTPDGNRIVISNGQIKELTLQNAKKIGDKFLERNTSLTALDLPNVKEIGDNFLKRAKSVVSINLPSVEKLGDYFLHSNESLKSINLPNVEKLGDYFLENNEILESVNLPKVKEIGEGFLDDNIKLKSISLPNVEVIGDLFLFNNTALTTISLPKVKKIGSGFLRNNEALTSIKLPNVIEIDGGFLRYNEALASIELPKAEKIGDGFLNDNQLLTSINLPKVKEIGEDFLVHNEKLKSINMPNVEVIGDLFLFDNTALTTISLPKVKKIGSSFLNSNYRLRSIELPESYIYLAKNLLARGKQKTRKMKNASQKFLKLFASGQVPKDRYNNDR